MAENPYQAPQSNVEVKPAFVVGSGDFTIGQCTNDAWVVTKANFGLLLGTLIVGGLLILISYVTIIGIFVLVPVFGWGMIKLYLNTYDGKGEFGDLFSGFKQYGQSLGSMLLLFLVMMVIGVLINSVYYVGAITENDQLMIIGFIIGAILTCLISLRLYFAPMYIVDQGMGAMDSISASWKATSNKKFAIILLAIVAVLIMYAGIFALLVGALFTMPMSYMMFISAYRQMVGRPDEEYEEQ